MVVCHWRATIWGNGFPISSRQPGTSSSDQSGRKHLAQERNAQRILWRLLQQAHRARCGWPAVAVAQGLEESTAQTCHHRLERQFRTQRVGIKIVIRRMQFRHAFDLHVAFIAHGEHVACTRQGFKQQGRTRSRRRDDDDGSIKARHRINGMGCRSPAGCRLRRLRRRRGEGMPLRINMPSPRRCISTLNGSSAAR